MRLSSSVMFLFSPSFSLPFSKCSFLQNSSGSVVSFSSISTQTSSCEHWAFWVGGLLGLVFSMWLGSMLISMGYKFVIFTISATSGRASGTPEISVLLASQLRGYFTFVEGQVTFHTGVNLRLGHTASVQFLLASQIIRFLFSFK